MQFRNLALFEDPDNLLTTGRCGNVLPHTALGNLGIDKIRGSQELFASEVLPALRELEVAAPA